MSKFLGANLAFNNQWTTITSIKDSERNVVGWEFNCGCDHCSQYKQSQFNDPYAAAITAMEFHRCER